MPDPSAPADLIEAHGIEEGLLLRFGEPVSQAVGEQDHGHPDVWMSIRTRSADSGIGRQPTTGSAQRVHALAAASGWASR